MDAHCSQLSGDEMQHDELIELPYVVGAKAIRQQPAGHHSRDRYDREARSIREKSRDVTPSAKPFAQGLSASTSSNMIAATGAWRKSCMDRCDGRP